MMSDSDIEEFIIGAFAAMPHEAVAKKMREEGISESRLQALLQDMTRSLCITPVDAVRIFDRFKSPRVV